VSKPLNSQARLSGLSWHLHPRQQHLLQSRRSASVACQCAARVCCGPPPLWKKEDDIAAGQPTLELTCLKACNCCMRTLLPAVPAHSTDQVQYVSHPCLEMTLPCLDAHSYSVTSMALAIFKLSCVVNGKWSWGSGQVLTCQGALLAEGCWCCGPYCCSQVIQLLPCHCYRALHSIAAVSSPFREC
jgi:hypothetical protein